MRPAHWLTTALLLLSITWISECFLSPKGDEDAALMRRERRDTAEAAESPLTPQLRAPSDDGSPLERQKREYGTGGGGMDPLDILIIVCNNLQLLVPACRLVPPLTQRLRERIGRQKRSFFDFNWDSFFSSHPTPSPSPSAGSSSSSSSSFDYLNFGNPWYMENVTCPQQTNQSAVYMFSSNATDYPAVAIAAELAGSPDLFDCLSATVILDDEPQLQTDDFMMQSNATCPFQQKRVFSYFSQQFNTTCFYLQNFQDNLLVTQCLNSTTLNCQQQHQQKDPFWELASSPSWFHSSTQNITRSLNRCVAEYGKTSLWSYCPSLAAGQRVIRDRVIVPTACLAFSVPCQVLRTRIW